MASVLDRPTDEFDLDVRFLIGNSTWTPQVVLEEAGGGDAAAGYEAVGGPGSAGAPENQANVGEGAAPQAGGPGGGPIPPTRLLGCGFTVDFGPCRNTFLLHTCVHTQCQQHTCIQTLCNQHTCIHTQCQQFTCIQTLCNQTTCLPTHCGPNTCLHTACNQHTCVQTQCNQHTCVHTVCNQFTCHPTCHTCHTICQFNTCLPEACFVTRTPACVAGTDVCRVTRSCPKGPGGPGEV